MYVISVLSFSNMDIAHT